VRYRARTTSGVQVPTPAVTLRPGI
jgi:hypothetical protein